MGHIPAENVRWALVDDDGVLSVEVTGDVVEAALGAPTLALHRRIVASTAEPVLRVEDTVRNTGWVRAGHMFRRHLNLGAPVVVPGTVVTATADLAGERDRTGPASVTLPWTLDVADGAGTRGGAPLPSAPRAGRSGRGPVTAGCLGGRRAGHRWLGPAGRVA